jgi:hypothetical protein
MGYAANMAQARKGIGNWSVFIFLFLVCAELRAMMRIAIGRPIWKILGSGSRWLFLTK